MDNSICGCKFVAKGKPMDSSSCLTHDERKCHCGQCSCTDYRPIADRIVANGRTIWASCVCGHIAQEHN